MDSRDDLPQPRQKPSPPPVQSKPANDRNELASFRHDINLIAFAASKGYAIDESESQRTGCVMRRGKEDKIAVSRAPDGHWQYYSWYDDRDNGDIIQFVQNRATGHVDPDGGRAIYPLGKVRKELREWTHTERPAPDVVPQAAAVVKDREAVVAEYSRATVVDRHPELERRALTAATFNDPRFRGTWRQTPDGYRNVIFPHRDREGICGFEVKNRGFTGFSTGGAKGLWLSRCAPSDQRLVITESAIDALSYHQVNPHPKTRYASTAGAQSRQQPDLIDRAISWMPAGGVIVAATDNDAAGQKYAKTIAELCAKHSHVSFERHAPALGKDWNEHLQTLRRQHRDLVREPPRTRGIQR